MQSINRLIDKSKNLSRAFTIIELLVVIGIIAILMGVLIGTFSGSSESARAAKCQANMHNLAMAVQAYGMATNYYPRASAIEKYKDNGRKETEIVPGWLSEESQSDPYIKGDKVRRDCLESGALWQYMKGNRSSYVCPSHQRYAKEKTLGDPLWSYAMSSYFDPGSSTGPRSGEVRRKYGSFRRADRYLLFAEVPCAQVKVGGTEIQSETRSGNALDPVLKEGSEVIGFNHKDGKNVTGHVCFADGHVEKLRAPKNKSNIKDLTAWLCRPTDNAQGDFDISYSDGTYKRDFSQATE